MDYLSVPLFQETSIWIIVLIGWCQNRSFCPSTSLYILRPLKGTCNRHQLGDVARNGHNGESRYALANRCLYIYIDVVDADIHIPTYTHRDSLDSTCVQKRVLEVAIPYWSPFQASGVPFCRPRSNQMMLGTSWSQWLYQVYHEIHLNIQKGKWNMATRWYINQVSLSYVPRFWVISIASVLCSIRPSVHFRDPRSWNDDWTMLNPYGRFLYFGIPKNIGHRF